TKVSIIVPLYNAGADFNACMASLIAQTWSALEIIIVNDGSTDVNVVSFACGALMTSATCVSLATGAGGTTTVSGTAIRDEWRKR
ncbi:glycosyltransferase, partial [Salmonella enterica subsp. enterica serovar Virginia]|nr:glycosyltransferase [Salmonella enterica subsp. enterica serovar Virginia]